MYNTIVSNIAHMFYAIKLCYVMLLVYLTFLFLGTKISIESLPREEYIGDDQ